LSRHQHHNFDEIRKSFYERFRQGKEIDAINWLCSTLHLNSSNAFFRMAPEIRGAYAIAQGNRPIEILLSPLIFAEDFDFGLLTRILAHELLHVEQRTRRFFPINDHNEREILAYADTLFRQDLPPVASKMVRQDFALKALDYYPRLSWWKQLRYRKLKEQLALYLKRLE
jgi:hypothetical protein